MIDKRETFIYLVFGETGVGKTFRTMKIIEQYVKIHKRPALILDVNNEFNGTGDFGKYKAIAYDVEEENEAKRVRNIRKIRKPAIYRLVTRYKNGLEYEDTDIIKAAVDIFINLSNAIFLLEDINSSIQTQVPKGFYSRLTRARHSGVDIIIHYQNVGDPPPKIIKNTTWIRLHKAGDSILDLSSKKYEQHTEMMRIAEIITETEYLKGNKRFNCLLNKRTKKIRNVTPEQFRKACAVYLSENPATVKRILYRKDVNGNPIYKNEKDLYNTYIAQKEDYYLS